MHPDLVQAKTHPQEWASQAAANIRVMCKHLLDMKVKGYTYCGPEVQAFLEKIHIDKEATQPPATPLALQVDVPTMALQKQEPTASNVVL